MTEFSVTIESEELTDYLENFPEDTFEPAKKVFATSVLVAEKEVKKNATTILKTRTGFLKRSIRSSVTGKDINSLKAFLYSGAVQGEPLVYAPIHELGGTIKAKNAYKNVPGGPFLNIPGKANLTPAGVMRKSAKSVFEDGGHIVGRTVHSEDYTELMFYLVKEVEVKPQLGMVEAAEKQMPIILSELKRLIGEE